MKQQKHNPAYQLVSKTINYPDGSKIELVYGIANNGENEGLEVYHIKPDGSHYSRRYVNNSYPAKYRFDFVQLRRYVRQGEVKQGHKLSIN